MKTNFRRPMMVFLLVVFIFIFQSEVAFADTAANDIDAFNAMVMRFYRLIRNGFVFPMVIVSFAWSGIQFLLSPMRSSPMVMDKVKSQLFSACAALLIVIILPDIVIWGINFFQATGWQPPKYDFLEQEVPPV